MHFTVPLFSLLSTGAFALPSSIESKRQFSYNGPLGAAEACPSNDQRLLSDMTTFIGAPPNIPNYQCIPWSTSADLIGINLFLSNSSALQAYSDEQCTVLISFIEDPLSVGDDQFCVKQSQNGGAGLWHAVMYKEP